MTEKSKLPPGTVWGPVAWDIPDAAAIQALARGDAAPEQQKRALTWFIEKAAGTYEPSYRANSARDSDFAEGRRHVGLQAVKLLVLNLAKLKEPKP